MKTIANRRRKQDDKNDHEVLRPKGFGFVTFLCEKDALTAVEKSSGLKICNREVAIDFCMNKESFMKYGKTGEEENMDETTSIADNNTTTNNNNNKIEDTTHDIVKNEEVNNETDEEEEPDEDDTDETESNVDDEEDPEGGEEEEEEEENIEEEEENEEEEVERSVKDKKDLIYGDDVKEGCSVFIRGLPFDAVTIILLLLLLLHNDPLNY